jgi:hypothetical protein
MKSILKKTLGVLFLILIAPITAIITNYFISVEPDPITAIKHGMIINLIILTGIVFGIYAGNFVSWCFKK